MKNSYWNIERWRFITMLALGVLSGLLTGYFLISLVIALLIYIVWILFKLQQLNDWLQSGSKFTSVPDSNGIWEQINYHVQKTRKANTHHKMRMAAQLKRTRNIISSLPYATILLNQNNEIEWANKQSYPLLNIDNSRDVGLRIDSLIRAPEIKQLLSQNDEKEIELTSAYNDQLRLVFRLIPVQSNMRLLIGRDISEHVRLQNTRKNFIANASHELRTPLSVIAGNLEMMQEDKQLPQSFHPMVTTAFKQSKRMQYIIQDLLTLSELENTEIKEEKNSILDMVGIIKHICQLEKELDKGNHHLDISQLDEHLKLYAVESEIISVCSNLIHNAFCYTPAASTITLIWKRLASGCAMLMVKDEGDGIPLEHISHLTERFYRTNEGISTQVDGTGLGLAIVSHVLQRHDSRLNIRSWTNMGSEFEVIFPAQRIIDDITTNA